MNICKGTTAKNCACKNKVKKGDYCSSHKSQRIIKFYPNIDNWPSSIIINKRIHGYLTVDLVLLQISYYETEFLMNTNFNGPGDEKIKERESRIFTISVIELIKFNIDICYGHPRIDFFVDKISQKFYAWGLFDVYIEDFKKKCLKSYREQAQKRVICFYFKHVEGLCFDVVEKIMGYV